MSVHLELTWGAHVPVVFLGVDSSEHLPVACLGAHLPVVPLGMDSYERLPVARLGGASACCIPGGQEGNPGYWTRGWPATSHS